MAYEKRLKAVSPQLFTADGTNLGKVTIPDACAFKVKQQVILRSSTQSPVRLEVKRVDGDNVLFVGPLKDHQHNASILDRTDISAFLVVDGASIYAEEQKRPNIPEQEIERLTYEEEPTVARRVILVDSCGDMIGPNNPLPVDAVLNIGAINVDLDAKTGDNVAISAHPLPIFSESSDSLTTAGYKEIFSYTSVDANTKVVYITAAISTNANVRLKINGVIKREYRTNAVDRQAHFLFHEHRPLPLGTKISIEAEPEKFYSNNAPYSTFTALEGYIA